MVSKYVCSLLSSLIPRTHSIYRYVHTPIGIFSLTSAIHRPLAARPHRASVHRAMDDTKLLIAIREGTLSDNDAKGQLLKRRYAIAIDEDLPPDLRARALQICDKAFKSGIFEATSKTPPFVTFLHDALEEIALVYKKRDARLTPSQRTRTSTPADPTEHTLEPIPDSEPDLKRRSLSLAAGRRSRSVTLERSMVADAVETRQLRKCRAHCNTDTPGKDSKRRLYGPPKNVPKTKEPADPLPSLIVKLRVSSTSDSNKSLGVSVPIPRRSSRTV